MLNGLGRDDGDPAVHREADPETKGNILQWKRKAEEVSHRERADLHDHSPRGFGGQAGRLPRARRHLCDVMVNGEASMQIPQG